MGIFELILISLSLSMDAFAVSVTLGLSVKNPKTSEVFIPAIYFGFFQALMTSIGYFAGSLFAVRIQNLDHWIVFILLSLIGGKMIWESFSKDEQKLEGNPFQFIKMLILAIATSIDALAVGLTLPFFNINILYAALLIGFITFFVSILGVKIGKIFGIRFKSKAEFVGGLILVALGIKILIEHLFLI